MSPFAFAVLRKFTEPLLFRQPHLCSTLEFEALRMEGDGVREPVHAEAYTKSLEHLEECDCSVAHLALSPTSAIVGDYIL